MKSIFEIIKKESKEYWLELKGCSGGAKIINGKEVPLWDIHVVCKWDGCTDYYSYNNGYEYDHECSDDCGCSADYIHICDIDSFINELKDIKSTAVKYYKGKSGEEYWKNK